MSVHTTARGFSSSGLLRVPGLPASEWIRGSNPALFEQATRLVDLEAMRRAASAVLADCIGTQLVPIKNLGKAERRFLLDIRRRLHRGEALDPQDWERLIELARSDIAHSAVERTAQELGVLQQSEDDLRLDLTAAIAAEWSRLSLLPSQISSASPIARAILTPSRRQSALELQWRLLTRAATVATPRGLFSHVALLKFVAGQPDGICLSPQFASYWMENIRTARLRSSRSLEDWPQLDSQFSLNPLQWRSESEIVVIALDDSQGPTRVRLPRTAELDAVSRFLEFGPRTFRDLIEEFDCKQASEVHAVEQLARMLESLDFIQPTYAPATCSWRSLEPVDRSQTTSASEAGWVDTYRFVEGGVSTDFLRAAQSDVMLAWRVMSAKHEVGTAPLPKSDADTAWNFTDMIRAVFNEGSVRGEHAPREGAATRSASSSVESLAADHLVVGDTLVLDHSILDDFGVPVTRIDWPMDCLVRLNADGIHLAAVDEIWPAGQLDARFAEALTDMHGPLPHMVAYHEFLLHLEKLTGALFVEVLAPPMVDRAANAVRRPLYTSAWTGDPHADAYFADGAPSARFVPLSAIQMRRNAAGRLLANINGQWIWPIHHASRTFSRPWAQIAHYLLAASPFPVSRYPGRVSPAIRSYLLAQSDSHLPQVTSRNGAVIAPRQWLLARTDLWAPSASQNEKVLALVALRRRHGLARWVWIIRDDGTQASACDLESVLSLRLIEQASRAGTHFRLEEMAPQPDLASVSDRAHEPIALLGSQIMFRLPHDESPQAMAERIAPSLSAAFGKERLTRENRDARLQIRAPPGWNESE